MAKKILVADDDFAQRDLYFELFKGAGFEVTAANDGQDAWEKIQKDRPDLVFTGILMPRMTGFELIDKLRNNRSTETTPIIIFSHLGREEDRKKAGKLAFVEFMVKGYDRPANILKKAQELMTTPHGQSPVLNPDEDDRQGFTVL
jgi:CheY-like chemotaxis protein